MSLLKKGVSPLPQINFKWPFYDDPISDKVLEQMESFTDNKNEIVFFSGKFKLHYHKISKSYYDNFQGQILCSSYVKTQQINIFAIPISVTKGQEKKWSAFQGNMTWEEAKIKCESIGMRLPTASELFYAPKHVWDKDTDVAEDGETSFYWDSKK
ncbi:MAG: hypothetical protein IPG24_27525 [Leptospiraceae bacterium]|nr:hypothetical protein [Leptospiraceae bacterium]